MRHLSLNTVFILLAMSWSICQCAFKSPTPKINLNFNLEPGGTNLTVFPTNQYYFYWKSLSSTNLHYSFSDFTNPAAHVLPLYNPHETMVVSFNSKYIFKYLD